MEIADAVEAVGNGGTTTAEEGDLGAAHIGVDVDRVAARLAAQTADDNQIVDGHVVAYSAVRTEVIAGKGVAGTAGTLAA